MYGVADIAVHYCLRFARGVKGVAMADYNADHYCLRFARGVTRAAMAGYNLDY